jgi:hypothetical protein
VDIGRNVLLFTAALAFIAPLVFSVIPAMQASRADVNESLKDATAERRSVRAAAAAGAGRLPALARDGAAHRLRAARARDRAGAGALGFIPTAC